MADQNLVCTERNCKSPKFVFTEGEQRFYAEKGFTPPKRCPECRAAKKASQPQKEQPAAAPKKVEFINEPPAKADRHNDRSKPSRRGGRDRNHYDDDN